MNNFQTCLEKLRSDNSSGAAELAEQSIACLHVYLKENLKIIGKITKEELKNVITKLSGFHPMASILHQLLLIYIQLEPILPIVSYQKLEETIQTSTTELKNWKTQTVTNLRRLISSYQHILVFSYSSTVMEALKKLSKKQQREITIFIPEARPLNEGHNVAQQLAKLHFKEITLGVDMAMHTFIQQTDLIVLGCDTLLSNGTVINKLGSTSISLLAKKYNREVVVATDPSKISLHSFLIDATWLPQIKEHDPAEVTSLSDPNIDITNKYFEAIPPEFIDKILIGDRITTKPHLKSLNKYFNDLYTDDQQFQLVKLLEKI